MSFTIYHLIFLNLKTTVNDLQSLTVNDYTFYIFKRWKVHIEKRLSRYVWLTCMIFDLSNSYIYKFRSDFLRRRIKLQSIYVFWSPTIFILEKEKIHQTVVSVEVLIKKKIAIKWCVIRRVSVCIRHTRSLTFWS